MPPSSDGAGGCAWVTSTWCRPGSCPSWRSEHDRQLREQAPIPGPTQPDQVRGPRPLVVAGQGQVQGEEVTVAELIERLRPLNPELPVVVYYWNGERHETSDLEPDDLVVVTEGDGRLELHGW